MRTGPIIISQLDHSPCSPLQLIVIDLYVEYPVAEFWRLDTDVSLNHNDAGLPIHLEDEPLFCRELVLVPAHAVDGAHPSRYE